MTSPTLPDPSQWLTQLMESQNSVLWPGGQAPEESAQALAQWTQTVAPWTKALNDLAAMQATLFQQQTKMMQDFAAPWFQMMGLPSPTDPIKDRRFAGEAWSKDPRFEMLARTYLAQTEAMFKTLEKSPLDEKSKAQWGFALRQIADAISPSNMLLTNPDAMEKALETGGASLIEGARIFAEDLAKGRVQMTDTSAFEVGTDVGVTPGTVIFQNETMQLIQYKPTTEEVYETPLLIVPPCINKYYILDLQPKNSFVAHAVAEGHTVFLVSWVNASEAEAHLTWDDYLESGVLTAIEVALKIRKAEQLNVLGFCIGGTLLCSALAVLAARGEFPAASLTLLATMLDFSDPGEIGIMVSEDLVKHREQSIGKGGLLQGKELNQVFASLRANDLIWPYVVQGYLKGEPPPAFDLLFWNSDDTNLPGPMYCTYLRTTYLENKLRVPGALTMLGELVDLGKVTTPSFIVAAKEDHIVPWKTAYTSVDLLGGQNTFVLGASGHIAGIVNPPARKKRNYWYGGDQSGDADAWLNSAKQVPGSWWPAWYAWLEPFSGQKVPTPKQVGNTRYKKIEDAPGTYVKTKAS